MINIRESYRQFCKFKEIRFDEENSILSYDESVLFCPAGMQKYKTWFQDTSIQDTTIANIQSCLRLNDLGQIGDKIHLAYFNMMGLFSFRGWDIKKAINFWMEYLELIELKPDYVTVHPDKEEWADFHTCKNVKEDVNCKWSDGEIGGYCTEFYINGVEIGNIVNPLGNCIDVGFGLERLENLVNNTPPISRLDSLAATCLKMIENGVVPSNIRHGYVLRKLLRTLHFEGGSISHIFFENETKRQVKLKEKYLKLKDKHADKSAAWWFETHGIDVELNDIKSKNS